MLVEAIIVIAIIFIGFLIYGIPFGIPRIGSDEFFLMSKTATIEQYNDTTVTYSLQVSVTIYFIYWGYAYGLSNIFFILSWFLGLFAFALAAPKLAAFVAETANRGSFFAFLAGNSGWLRRFMGLLFATSLIGLLFTELYFTAQFVEALSLARQIHAPAPHLFFWISFVSLVVLVLWYCSLGGMRKVVETNTWQLAISYMGSAVFIAGLADSVRNGGAKAFYFVYFGMAALYLLMAIAPGLVAFFETRRFSLKKLSHITFWSLLISAGISLLPLLLLPAGSSGPPAIFPKPVGTMLTAPYGWAAVVGFGMINLVWQFSDYTAYHRLSLLEIPERETDRISKIKESIYATMLNSPLTWALGIFAGMAIDASNIVDTTDHDVFAKFVTAAAGLANKGDLWIQIALCGLAAFLANVMLSTVDTGFMSVVQIVVRDILQIELSQSARILVNVVIAVIMFIFAVLVVTFEIRVLVFLNTTYSWGLVFGGLGIAVLFGRRIPSVLAFVALFAGAAIGTWGTSNPLGLPELVALIFPSTAAIVVSSLVILLSMPFGRPSR